VDLNHLLTIEGVSALELLSEILAGRFEYLHSL